MKAINTGRIAFSTKLLLSPKAIVQPAHFEFIKQGENDLVLSPLSKNPVYLFSISGMGQGQDMVRGFERKRQTIKLKVTISIQMKIKIECGNRQWLLLHLITNVQISNENYFI